MQRDQKTMDLTGADQPRIRVRYRTATHRFHVILQLPRTGLNDYKGNMKRTQGILRFPLITKNTNNSETAAK